MSATDLVHHCIVERGQMPRAEIGRALGLSSRAVKVAVDELLRRGDIAITGYQASSGGRRSQILGAGLGPETRVAIGVVFQQEEIRLVLVDASGQIQASHAITDASATWDELFLNRACEAVQRFAKEHVTKRMSLCGVGISSVLAFQAMVLCDAKWGNHFVASLSRRLGVPVYRELLVRCVTLAEYLFGTTQREPNMAYLSVMDHVEMGVIMGGRLLCSSEATRSSALGHLSVDPEGEPCYCGGRGCLESYVSCPRVLERVSQALQQGRASTLRKKADGPVSISDVMAGFVAGDAVATEAIEVAVKRMIPALRAIQLLLSPQLIVLGGYLRHGGRPLIDLIEQSFQADLPVQTVGARIHLSDAAFPRQAVGAAALALAYDLHAMPQG